MSNIFIIFTHPLGESLFMQKTVLEITEHKDVIVVRSLELYNYLRLGSSHYNRWVQRHIIPKGVKNEDYFEIPNAHIPRHDKNVFHRFYLHIDFAISLTYMQDTYLAKSLRRELKRIKAIRHNG